MTFAMPEQWSENFISQFSPFESLHHPLENENNEKVILFIVNVLELKSGWKNKENNV